jgi:hypothetical protein
VADSLRLTKEVGPYDLTRRIGIMLEAQEGQVRDTVAGFQVIEEATEP